MRKGDLILDDRRAPKAGERPNRPRGSAPEQMTSKGDRDFRILLAVAGLVSLAAFLYYFRQNAILMYGDAIAHINIARRVFDSRTPGLSQLGTVWLPLPHLLIMPFIVSTWMWKTGVGGSIPSMVAYVAGVAGVFRLVRDGLAASEAFGKHARTAAVVAALIYGANPNLIYMQSTAMTESLSLALFIWAVVFFADFVRAAQSSSGIARHAERSLLWCALMLSGEMLTRYDGWFVACFFALALLFFLLKHRSAAVPEPSASKKYVFLRFAAMIAIVPALWFAHNYAQYGNPLEFATGPYSARGIAERTTRPGDSPYPGKDHPVTAALHFVKAAKLNLAGHDLSGEYHRYWRRTWQEDTWVVLTVCGTFLLLLFAPGLWPWLLLWLPIPFYALSIAYSGVPIFMPVWWPFSYYNVRYGLQLLPAAAVFVAALYTIVVSRLQRSAIQCALAAALCLFVAVSYFGTWKAGPICYREAYANSRQREALQSQLAALLAELPADATILMNTGEHVGALQRAGIPLRRTVNENNYYPWRDALRHPERMADVAVAFNNDAVQRAITESAKGSWDVLATFDVPGQAHTTVYRNRGRK